MDKGSPYSMVADPTKPSPSDLVAYLPWVCNQMQCQDAVSVVKVTQMEYVNVGTTKKAKPKSSVMKTTLSTPPSSVGRQNKIDPTLLDEEWIKIYAIHDICDHLVELKFDKNPAVPRLVLQLLGLVIQYQKHLTTITVNSGLNAYGIYEINKFIATSYVTDLIFDDTFFKEANYYVLLETQSSLKRLSLARCKINDDVLKTITDKLVHPLPASKMLMVLDLSMNLITDKGAKIIADMLRSNRCLSYLNLSGNGLTDIGGRTIFDVLTIFPLTNEELMASKMRLMNYLKGRNILVAQIFKKLRRADTIRSKRKPIKGQSIKKAKIIEGSTEPSQKDSFIDMDSLQYDKAIGIVEEQIGKFKDPFMKDNLFVRDGIVYCFGNNALCCLNMSYNYLSFISLKKLTAVVVSQRHNNRKPIGLINVCVDGNELPINCVEAMRLDDILHPSIDKLKKNNPAKCK